MIKNNLISPAELLTLSDIKNPDVGFLIKLTFYSLVSKGNIKIKRLEVKSNTRESAFFLFKNDRIQDNLNPHEKVIMSYLNSSKPIPLKQLVYYLSNYLNPAYRFIFKKYRYESFVLHSLQLKGLIGKKGILKKKSYTTQRGVEVKKMIYQDHEDIINYFKPTYQNIISLLKLFDLKYEHENELYKVEKEFNHYIKKGTKRDFMAFPNIGDNYPEPKNSESALF
ncbi:MAG: hypothetical protein ACOCVN_01585 [bacterium]